MSSASAVSPQRFEICTHSLVLAVPVATVFAFCTSRTGFLAHYPNPIRAYRGDEQWLLGSEFWLDYRYFGVPQTWHGKVTQYELNHHFTDLMVSGMFRYWEHTHSVEAAPEGTKYTDSVRFSMGFGRMIDRYFVK